MKTHIVYMATSINTGLSYVGVTGKRLRARINNHTYKARKSPQSRFHKAIAEEGIKSFVFSELFRFGSGQDAYQAEEDIIDGLSKTGLLLNRSRGTRTRFVDGLPLNSVRQPKTPTETQRSANRNLAGDPKTAALWHPVHGYAEMTKSQLHRLCGGDRTDIRRLLNGKTLSVKGWSLATNKDVPRGRGNCRGRLKRML
mgnify:FL=1